MFKPRGERATGSSAVGQPDADVGETPREPPRPRPLLGPALALILGIWLSDLAGPVSGLTRILVLAAPLLALSALLALWRRHGSGHVLLIGAAGVVLTVGFARHQSVIHCPAHHLAHALGTEPVLTRLAGRIIKPPITRPGVKYNAFLPFNPPAKTCFVLAADELCTTDPPQPITGHVRVTVEATGLDLRVGQRMQLTGKLYQPSGPRNPGQRDWARWNRRQGIDAGLTVEGAAHVKVLSDNATRWQRLTSWVRGTAQSLLFEPYADLDAEESVRLLDVMVLGQRSTADRRLNEAFRNAGGMHFLAVSGFHAGVLALAVWWFVRRVLRRGRRTTALITLLATLTYALLVAEPNAPILRAATFVCIAAVTTIMNRPLCVMNSLALAGGILLLYDPGSLFRASFQLSFVVVLALVSYLPLIWLAFARHRPAGPPREALNPAELIVQRIGRWATGLFVVCCWAALVAAPLVLFHFGHLAPWGWLGAFALTLLVSLTIVLSLITLAGNLLFHLLSLLTGATLAVAIAWLGMPLRRCTELLLWAVGWFEHLPGPVIECQPPPAWLVVLTYLILGALAWRQPVHLLLWHEMERRRARLTLAGTLVALGAPIVVALSLEISGGSTARSQGHDADFAVHVLAVGTGTATLLTAPGGHTAVYDVGTITNSDAGQTAAEALRALGRREVEAVLISHANFDHYSGLPTLMERCRVASWLTNPYFIARGAREGPVGKLLALLPADAPAPQTLRAGDRLALGTASLDVLWPPAGLAEGWVANDRSVVVRFQAADRTVLLTGDVESDALQALLDDHRAGRINLHADVLVAPHHGAVRKDATAAFYAAVAPRYVIVSSHTPRPRLRALVRDVLGPDCPVLLTGDVGAVTVYIHPEGDLTIDTPYASDENPPPEPRPPRT